MILRWHIQDGEADPSGERGGSGGGSDGEKPDGQHAKPDGQQEPPPIPADSKAPEKQEPKPDASKDGGDIARLTALVEGLATKVSGLVEANTALQKQASDQAKETRKQAMATALEKAGLDPDSLSYARQDLGDLDVDNKETDAKKLSDWIEKKSRFFAKKGGVSPSPRGSEKPAKKGNASKLFGGRK